MITAIEPSDALSAVALALTSDTGGPSSCIKPALRRALYWLAPASRSDIIRFVAEPLVPLGLTREQLEESLDELIAFGDALEMRKLPTDPWNAPATVLRPAPPSFVVRSDKSIVLLGVSGDQPTALTSEIARDVEHGGPVRLLRNYDPSLPAQLRLLGLTPLAEAAWLRAPTIEAAEQHVALWQERVGALPAEQAAIPDLRILDPIQPVRYYRSRWRDPSAATSGTFVARRPQAYGSDLWSFADFEQGNCFRLLDLRDDSDRQRPCDIAWRLQCALDATLGHPQEVALTISNNRAALDFFSPLPAFAERRLSITATKSTPAKCLFRYDLSQNSLASEILALEQTLWLQIRRTEDPI